MKTRTYHETGVGTGAAKGVRTGARFWAGFTTGAVLGTVATATAYMAANALNSRTDSRILRLESSIQIGRGVEDVFSAWADYSRIAEYVPFVRDVTVSGNRSHWEIAVDGKDVSWDSVTTRFIRNQAIGWKSVRGPKHSGRVTFSKMGDPALGNVNDQTLMLVTLNYAPPLGRFSHALSPVTEHLEKYLAQALRDFKEALEQRPAGDRATADRRGHESKIAPQAEWRVQAERKATGTDGTSKGSTSNLNSSVKSGAGLGVDPRVDRGAESGGDPGVAGTSAGPIGVPGDSERSGKVDYTRPPEARYPFGKK